MTLKGLIEAFYKSSERMNNPKAIQQGEIETALMLEALKDLDIEDRFIPGYIGEMTSNEINLVFQDDMKTITQSRVLEDSTKAKTTRGEVYATTLVEEIKKKM